jgi:sugar phosphate isomerase/epimerase
MNRLYSLGHLTALSCPPPELVKIAAAAGYDFVSPRIIPFGEPSYDLAKDKAMLRATKSALADTGLSVLDVELARILPGLDPETYVPAFEAAAELGAKYMTSSIWTPDAGFAAATLARMCELATACGLAICIEYLPFVPIAAFADQLDIIRKADRSNCGLLVDAMFTGPNGIDFATLATLPANLIHYVQLCDGPKQLPPLGTPSMFEVVRGGRLYLGEGEIDLPGLLARLPPVPCSLEVPHAGRIAELGALEHARRSLAAARRFAAAHPEL